MTCPLCNREIPRYSKFKIKTDLIYHLWGAHQYDLIGATKKADEILKGEKQDG